MATRIDSVAARAKLLARRDPYWQRLDVGSYLGDRKMTADSAGSWVARAVDRATGKKPTYELGQFTELPAHARFGAASKAARERFEHLGRGGSASPSTVRQVCARYVDSQREKLGEKAAKDAQARFANYVLNDQRLANLEVTKLTPAHVQGWVKSLRSQLLVGVPSNRGLVPTTRRDAPRALLCPASGVARCIPARPLSSRPKATPGMKASKSASHGPSLNDICRPRSSRVRRGRAPPRGPPFRTRRGACARSRACTCGQVHLGFNALLIDFWRRRTWRSKASSAKPD